MTEIIETFDFDRCPDCRTTGKRGKCEHWDQFLRELDPLWQETTTATTTKKKNKEEKGDAWDSKEQLSRRYQETFFDVDGQRKWWTKK
jgi:hypothetical protein